MEHICTLYCPVCWRHVVCVCACMYRWSWVWGLLCLGPCGTCLLPTGHYFSPGRRALGVGWPLSLVLWGACPLAIGTAGGTAFFLLWGWARDCHWDMWSCAFGVLGGAADDLVFLSLSLSISASGGHCSSHPQYQISWQTHIHRQSDKNVCLSCWTGQAFKKDVRRNKSKHVRYNKNREQQSLQCSYSILTVKYVLNMTWYVAQPKAYILFSERWTLFLDSVHKLYIKLYLNI